jgi:hypothetical protein
VNTLDALCERFSVEVVNKQFFEEVATLFTKLVGGERAGKNYRGLLSIQGGSSGSQAYQEFAVRLLGRIVFCWFLKEKKSETGVPLMPEDLLSVPAVKEQWEYYHNTLEPLFFEVLNKRVKDRPNEIRGEKFDGIPYLNGGLFNPVQGGHGDHYAYTDVIGGGSFGLLKIPNEWFEELFDVLSLYNFTIDENTSYDVELSIDPEMLGRIFENLLAEINPETGESARKSTGSFYTPREIVDYMVDSSLYYYLSGETNIDEDKLRALISYSREDDIDKPLSDDEKRNIVDAIAGIKILDPSCGSGAFPIGILQKLVFILQQTDETAEMWLQKQLSAIPSVELRHDMKEKYRNENYDYIRKLGVIRDSIYGVDIQTIATEIAKLRCFLTLIIEEHIDDVADNRGIKPLPNLDFKFVTANSLVGLPEEATSTSAQMTFLEDTTHIEKLRRIRDEYFTAPPEMRDKLQYEFVTVQKAMLKKTIDDFARSASKKYSLLSQWSPFENEVTDWFDSEWMFGVEKFNIVIANPPYIHLEHIRDKSAFYKTLNYKTYEARGDIYALFYEKGVRLLVDKGILCYITSNKWMRAAYGKSLRGFFAKITNPLMLIDFAGQQIFDATVDTNILLLAKDSNANNTSATIVRDTDGLNNMSVYVKQNSVTIPFATSDSWTILSPIEQSIKRKIEAVGTPLRDWDVKINRGILTGCNDAFIIDSAKRTEILSNCSTDAERKLTAELIRPILRGRDIKRYGYEFADQYLIALFPSRHYNIDEYPTVKEYLLSAEWSNEIPSGHGKEKLEQTGKKHTVDGITFRARKLTGNQWFETQDQIGYWDDFSKQKILWGELSDEPKFSLDVDGTYYAANTLFLMTGNDLPYLMTYLNSPIAKYFFTKHVATTSGIGTTRWLKYTLERLPIPRPNIESIDIMTSLIDQMIDGFFVDFDKLINYQIYKIFDFSAEEIDFIEEYQNKQLTS